MSDDADEQALIEPLFAPWDARAWENLKQTYSEVAEDLAAAVAAGVTPADIRRHAEQHGYTLRAMTWLEQAAGHLWRVRSAMTSDAAGLPTTATANDCE